MEAKEKAKELFFAMLNEGKGLISDYLAKQCALITVQEIMESNSDFAYSGNFWAGNKSYSDSEKYWQQVKQEIEKL